MIMILTTFQALICVAWLSVERSLCNVAFYSPNTLVKFVFIKVQAIYLKDLMEHISCYDSKCADVADRKQKSVNGILI